MRRLLFFIVITAMGMFKGHSQALVQTYTDRCTGATQVFTVPMNGTTVVAFYNRSKIFTSQDFQDGTLQAWLEETYLWWTSLSPCSTTTAGTTATQQTTQQTTQQATQAATNATANIPPPPATTNPTTNAPSSSTSPPPTSQTSNPPPAGNNTASSNTSSQGQSTGGTDNGSTGNTDTGSGSTETGSSETQSGSSESGSSSSETSESTDQSEGTSESKTEETKSEEKTEEVKEEKKEETKEEEKKDEESEEESKEEKKEKEKEKDKKEKKRALAPPIVMANMLSQQGPDGRYTQAAMFGISQSSLLGTETYGLNAMVFSNLQQFMLTANYSKVHINKEGRVNRVYSGSIGGMKMFTTYMGMMNHSMVWLGEKGSVKGLAFGTTLTSVELDIRKGLVYYDNLIIGTSLTGFYTKPFNYNKWSISPMIAISSPFFSYDLYEHTQIWNKDIMFIGGSSFTFKLTQRFGINFGINVIEATIKDFPTLKTFTIGGRLSF